MVHYDLALYPGHGRVAQQGVLHQVVQILQLITIDPQQIIDLSGQRLSADHLRLEGD